MFERSRLEGLFGLDWVGWLELFTLDGFLVVMGLSRLVWGVGWLGGFRLSWWGVLRCADLRGVLDVRFRVCVVWSWCGAWLSGGVLYICLDDWILFYVAFLRNVCIVNEDLIVRAVAGMRGAFSRFLLFLSVYLEEYSGDLWVVLGVFYCYCFCFWIQSLL